jgi:hypothetical protein
MDMKVSTTGSMDWQKGMYGDNYRYVEHKDDKMARRGNHII